MIVAGRLETRMDPVLARTLMENLVDNAWKFTRNTPARVEVGVAEVGGTHVFFVRDNGAGFDMARAGKLFTAFQRLHSPNEFSGTGIGLATCHRIVESARRPHLGRELGGRGRHHLLHAAAAEWPPTLRAVTSASS